MRIFARLFQQSGFRFAKVPAVVLAGLALSMASVGGTYAEEGGPGGIQKSGTAAQSQGQWELRDNGWYFYGLDGNPISGWILVDNQHYYLMGDGRCLMNAVAPDGYYVNQNGVWYARSAEILGTVFAASEKFPSATGEWIGKTAMGNLRSEISSRFQQRRIRITDNTIEYVSGEKDTVLLGIYKDAESGGYSLRLGTRLDKSSTEEDRTATYDYAVFRALLYQITSTPELLEDAVYSSWQENNRWNISRVQDIQVGDCMVKYMADSGYGYYYIYPAVAMRQE